MTIFGNKGIITNGNKRIKWWSNDNTQIVTNNTVYDGYSTTIFSNNTMWTKKRLVTKSGNTFNAPDGIYVLSGNILHGPKGQTWTGITSNEDIMSIIAHNNK